MRAALLLRTASALARPHARRATALGVSSAGLATAAATTRAAPLCSTAAAARSAGRVAAVGAVIFGGATVAYAGEQVEAYSPSKEEIQGCIAAIESVLDDNDDLGPTLVRLAWHASGTYCKETNTGGSDGATMRYAPESGYAANAGLAVAREALEPVKKLFPDVSYADIWTLAGAVAIEHMGGPHVIWNSGRRDAASEKACPPDGRLPDADKGEVGKTVRHVRDIFYRQGFNDREIVALVGAHALGRCHTDRSGYEGPWTRAPTTFSNEYFRELIENTWTLKKWEGPDQFEDPTGDLMMLPADMALIWDREFRKYVEMYAKDEELWFRDFAKAFQKLEENGVKALQVTSSAPWYKFW